MPSEPRIVQNAEQSPGVCLVSGDNEGPFLDTGRFIKRHGRVYLSLRHIEPYLRKAGYLPEKETAGLRGQLREALYDLEELQGEVDDLRALRAAVEPFVRKPEVVEREVQVYRHRDITDDDVEHFLKRNPRVLEKFKPAEPGSAEEWDELYRPKAPPAAATPAEPEAPPTSAPGGGPAADSDAPPREIEVDGVTIDLDEVLAQNVQTIVDYAEGHPELGAALAERELHTKPRGEPRKTVLALLDEVDS